MRVPDGAAGPARAAAPLDQQALLGLVGYNCRRAYLPILSLFLTRLAPLKLRPVEFSVLMLLSSNDQVTQKRLSEALCISPPNLAVLVERLQRRGLLERVGHPLDRRSRILHLTAAGRTLLQQARPQVVALEREATAALTDGERDQLMMLLQRIFQPRGALPVAPARRSRITARA
jgi:DNA-binding MarR family transcriptional regulator